MTARLIACALLLAAGAAAAWLMYPSSPPAAVISGIAVATAALAVLAGGRGARPRKPRAAGGKDALPGHAVAFRQSRAIARAEDGEIRGIPGGPY